MMQPMISARGLTAILTLGAATMSLAGCTATGASEMDLKQVQQAVDAGNAAWIDAFRKQDAAALAEVFTEDGALLQSDGQVARGREEIQTLMQAGMTQMGPTETTIETDKLWIVDNLAYETGRYTYSFTENGEKRSAAGRYVVVWRADGAGVWKIQVDMGLPDD